MTQHTVKFQLSEPVTVNKVTYTEFTFRQMKAKDLVASDAVKGTMKKSLALFASMADVPLPVIEEISIDDFTRLGEEIMPLMGKSGAKAVEEAQAQAVEDESE